MGVSAYQWALEKGARYNAGQEISADGDHYWDPETEQWLLFDSVAAAGETLESRPPPRDPPPRARAVIEERTRAVSGMLQLGLGAVALGAAAYLLWRR